MTSSSSSDFDFDFESLLDSAIHSSLDSDWASEWLEKKAKVKKETCGAVGELGKKEISVLASFNDFFALLAKIENRPSLKLSESNSFKSHGFNEDALKKVSVVAAKVQEVFGKVDLSTLGCFAAFGATHTEAITQSITLTREQLAKAKSPADTSIDIPYLPGFNMLTDTAAQIGLSGSSVCMLPSSLDIMSKEEKNVEKLFEYCAKLAYTAQRHLKVLTMVDVLYRVLFKQISTIVGEGCDWESLSQEDRVVIQNEVDIVSILYEMCKVQLVVNNPDDPEGKVVNAHVIEHLLNNVHACFAKFN